MQQRVPVVNISSSAARVPTKTGYTQSYTHTCDIVIICRNIYIYIYVCVQVYSILRSGTLARKLVQRDKKKKNNCIPVCYICGDTTAVTDLQTSTARILFTRRRTIFVGGHIDGLAVGVRSGSDGTTHLIIIYCVRLQRQCKF